MDITDHGILKNDSNAMIFCKGQDTFTPVGKFLDVEDLTDPYNLTLKLTVNGETRITGNTGDMIYKISKIMEMCSQYMTLEQGDLILTGTPVPPGTIKSGDNLHCQLSAGEKVLDQFEIKVEEVEGN